MQAGQSKKHSVLKSIFFYWLAYVLISTMLTFWGRRGSSYNPDLPLVVAIMTCVILLSFAVSIALFKHRKYLKDKFNNLSLLVRRFIWGTICWFTLVLSFVLIFSPFGRYMNDEDWATTWKIIIVPPLLIALGYFSYVKMLKGDGQSQN